MRVKRPVLVTTSGPVFIVDTLLFRANADPVRWMPEELVVEAAPSKVVVPLPALCVIEAALIFPKA